MSTRRAAGAEKPPVKEATPGSQLADVERDQRRMLVIQTAARLFSENGFRSTSLDDIAEALGVTKPVLYFYVKNKDEILFECVRKGLEMIDDAIGGARVANDASARLRATLVRYAEIMMMDFGRCISLTTEYELQPESARKFRRYKRSIDSRLRALVTAAMDEGAIPKADPKWAAFMLAGALNWIPRWFDPRGAENPSDIARQCVDALLRGVR